MHACLSYLQCVLCMTLDSIRSHGESEEGGRGGSRGATALPARAPSAAGDSESMQHAFRPQFTPLMIHIPILWFVCIMVNQHELKHVEEGQVLRVSEEVSQSQCIVIT